MILDDDLLFCDSVADFLSGTVAETVIANTVAQARTLCERRPFDVVILDNTLPDGSGLDVVPLILRMDDRAKIILSTAYPSFENAVTALKSGIYDYLSKPVELEELRLAVERAFQTTQLERVAQVQEYKTGAESEEAVLIGTGDAFAETRRLIDRAAAASAPVLITGETGTGKTLVAKAIHFAGQTRLQSFISVNCAAIPEALVESELFGVEKGAFTGATTRKGLFEIAEDGTLFLDEVAEMPTTLQSKLLGVLDDNKVRRLGSDLARAVRVRVIAATNVEPERAIADGKFRLDLYYRLNVVRIHLKPLRERRTDIPALCDFFLKKLAPTKRLELSERECARLMEYEWPGNIRELRNVLDRCLILDDGPFVEPSRLLAPAKGKPERGETGATRDGVDMRPLEVVEREHILRVFQAVGENNAHAAAMLGISLATLKRKLRTYGVERSTGS